MVKLTNNHYIGLERELPIKLTAGSIFVAVDSKTFYIYDQGGKPSIIPGDDIFNAFTWEFVDENDRLDPTDPITGLAYTEDDIGLFAWQLDDNTIYFLTDTTPTWTQILTGSILTISDDNIDIATEVSTINFSGDLTVTDNGNGSVTVNYAGADQSLSGSGISSYSGNQLIGTTITDVTLTWAWSPSLNSLDSQSFIGDGSTTLTYDQTTIDLSSLTITDDVIWQFSGTHSSYGSADFDIEILFDNYIYAGQSTSDVLTETEIESLTGYTEISNSAEVTWDKTSNTVVEYAYLCFPATLIDIPTIWVDSQGTDIPFSALTNVSITNSAGYTEDYIVQRSINAFAGSKTITAS